MLSALLLLTISATTALAGPPLEIEPCAEIGATQQAEDFDHEHASFTILLQKHVKPEGVDYAGLVQDKELLRAYIATLEKITPEGLAGWKREQRLAFWINVYNAHVLSLVVDEYPVKNVKLLGNVTDSAWDHKFIRLGEHEPARRKPEEAGQMLTLNQIAHGILRARFEDARIHAVLCWSAKSSPRLMPQALMAGSLDAQLDAQVRRWLAEPALNHFDMKRGSMRISKLFDWFEKDFIREAGSPRAWIARYAPGELGPWLASGAKVRVRYRDFSWDLNSLSK